MIEERDVKLQVLLFYLEVVYIFGKSKTEELI